MNYLYLTKIRKEQMYIIIVLTAKYMHYKFYAFGSEKNPDIHLFISISKLRHTSQQVCSCIIVYVPFLMNLLYRCRSRLLDAYYF